MATKDEVVETPATISLNSQKQKQKAVKDCQFPMVHDRQQMV